MSKPKPSNTLDLAIAAHKAARAATDAAERQGECEDEIARRFAKEFKLLETICDAGCGDDQEFFRAAEYVVACLRRDYDFDADHDGPHDGLLKRMLLTHLPSRRRQVLFDSCTVNSLAATQADPIRDFAGTEFEIVCTPDLRLEYQAAAQNAQDENVRQLAGRFAAEAHDIGIFGWGGPPFLGWGEGNWPSKEQIEVIDSTKLGRDRPTGIPANRTDSHLVALAQTAIVITNEEKAHWKRAPNGTGYLIRWSELKPKLLLDNNVAIALRQIVR